MGINRRILPNISQGRIRGHKNWYEKEDESKLVRRVRRSRRDHYGRQLEKRWRVGKRKD
jgi:hypothetical protein